MLSWALALWPASGATATWLARTRAVCFDAGCVGILLIGQPLGMVAVLLAVWGGAHGEPLDLDLVAGRPELVTFAFGHCETVCPLVVRQAIEAQRQVGRHSRSLAGVPRVVVVPLDPWRDTPSRLQHLASHWQTTDETFVLSGDVDAVNDVLDAWNVARSRDPQTGDITHPPLFYVLDGRGRITYAASGGNEVLVELLERSQPPR
jgi:cytochrome oxidase Cu insertion factor (SCO1/SenC/PrrC family)